MHRENGATLVMVPYLCNSPPQGALQEGYTVPNDYRSYIYIYRVDYWGAPSPRVFFPPFSPYEMQNFLWKAFRTAKQVASLGRVGVADRVTTRSDVGKCLTLWLQSTRWAGDQFLALHRVQGEGCQGFLWGFFGGSLKVVWLIDLRGFLATWIHLWGNLRLVKDYDSCRSRLCMLGWLGLGANFTEKLGPWGKIQEQMLATTSFPNAFNHIFQA